jgi:hypothetical protein
MAGAMPNAQLLNHAPAQAATVTLLQHLASGPVFTRSNRIPPQKSILQISVALPPYY